MSLPRKLCAAVPSQDWSRAPSFADAPPGDRSSQAPSTRAQSPLRSPRTPMSQPEYPLGSDTEDRAFLDPRSGVDRDESPARPPPARYV